MSWGFLLTYLPNPKLTLNLTCEFCGHGPFLEVYTPGDRIWFVLCFLWVFWSWWYGIDLCVGLLCEDLLCPQLICFSLGCGIPFIAGFPANMLESRPSVGHVTPWNLTWQLWLLYIASLLEFFSNKKIIEYIVASKQPKCVCAPWESGILARLYPELPEIAYRLAATQCWITRLRKIDVILVWCPLLTEGVNQFWEWNDLNIFCIKKIHIHNLCSL